MIRVATPDDAAAIECFLAGHAGTSMFLRGNLAAHGTDEKDHPHGTLFLVQMDADGVKAVVGLTNKGQLLCQAPGASDAFFRAVAEVLRGRNITGMTGDPAQVTAMLSVLGCNNLPYFLRETENLYALDLAKLERLDWTIGSLRLPQPEDASWLADWFRGFYLDTGLAVLNDSEAMAAAQKFVVKPDAGLLIAGYKPVAMTTLNARAGKTVQVGGVYVPPKHRGNGYGAEVVRQQLITLQSQGVRKAILFAANAYAERVYEGIGFQRIGSYEIALLAQTFEVPR